MDLGLSRRKRRRDRASLRQIETNDPAERTELNCTGEYGNGEQRNSDCQRNTFFLRQTVSNEYELHKKKNYLTLTSIF